MKKKKFVLVDAQDDKKLELHVAFSGVDNLDQVLCELPEKTVIELVKREIEHGWVAKDFDIDWEVSKYIKEKHLI